jgi:rhodanese-related sulfurtransferase
MKRIVVLMSFVVTIACSPSGAQSSELLAPSDFERKLTATTEKQIVDVRTAEEFAGSHVSGAVMIDYYKKDFKAQVAKLDRSKPVFIYCAAGGRSGSATEVLEELGFKKIYDLKGGMKAWINAGKPVIR